MARSNARDRADGIITSIVDGSVDSADIATNAITSAKIADGAITNTKLAPSARPQETSLVNLTFDSAQTLDLSQGNFFDADSTGGLNTTLSFANVPTAAKWTYKVKHSNGAQYRGGVDSIGTVTLPASVKNSLTNPFSTVDSGDQIIEFLTVDSGANIYITNDFTISRLAPIQPPIDNSLLLKSHVATEWEDTGLNWQLFTGSYTVSASTSGYTKTASATSVTTYGRMYLNLNLLDTFSSGVTLATDGFWAKWRCNYVTGSQSVSNRQSIGLIFDKQSIATSVSSGIPSDGTQLINSYNPWASIRTDRPFTQNSIDFPYIEDSPYTIPPGWTIDNSIGTRTDLADEYHAAYINLTTGVVEIWYSSDNSTWTKSHSVNYSTGISAVQSIYFSSFFRSGTVNGFELELLDGEDVSV